MSTSVAEYFMKNIERFDSTELPPCWKSLKQIILRTIYVTSMWKNATEANCMNYVPEQCEWAVNDNKIEPLWSKGDPKPLLVEDIVMVELDEIDNCDDESYDNDDHNKNNDSDHNNDNHYENKGNHDKSDNDHMSIVM